jgi:dethiobiotin synthase
VFTTASSPAVPAAFLAAMAQVRLGGEAAERALAAARLLAERLGVPAPAASIVPFVIGDEREALDAAAAAREAGFDVRAVRPPTVPPGTSRLRLACRADHTEAQLSRLAEVLRPFARTGIAATPRPTGARPLAVAGTGTGIGKTVVAALCTLAIARAGAEGASYWKPVQTGTDDDTAEVRRLVGQAVVQFAPPRWSLPLPASPHEAAAAAGVRIDADRIAADVAALPANAVCELAGGLLVPLDEVVTQLDVLARVRPRIVLAAGSGLGTLNHTLLSLEALRRRRLEPEALFVVGEPHPSNLETLKHLGGVLRVFEVPVFAPLDAGALARWLDQNDLSWLVR